MGFSIDAALVLIDFEKAVRRSIGS